MKTQEFFSLLEQNKGKSLQFEYQPRARVGANYHITEVKQVKVDSVNCGSGTEEWNETIVQLWESPLEQKVRTYMSTLKALDILRKVGQMKPYDMNAEIKFEYSNPQFHTAQLFVNEIVASKNTVLIKLAIEKTDCKAKGTCGIPEATTQRIAENACSPRSGCC